MTSASRWTFITNHGLVLSYIWRYPVSTAREIAMHVRVTERTTHKIISDLERGPDIYQDASGAGETFTASIRICRSGTTP